VGSMLGGQPAFSFLLLQTYLPAARVARLPHIATVHLLLPPHMAVGRGGGGSLHGRFQPAAFATCMV